MRHVDTGEQYGNNHEVKIALQLAYQSGDVRREDIWITSKLYDNLTCWIDLNVGTWICY